MTDDREQPTANRTTRIEQARAFLREGSNASNVELAWARRIVSDHEAEATAECQRTWTATITPSNGPVTWSKCPASDIDDVIRQRAERLFADVEGIHEAEVHAGKIGTLVVWRESEQAADRLAKWKGARIRVPNGSEHVARSSSGTIHDPEQDRWGVLYKAKDLRQP